jgi:hypothetical protein
MDWRRRGLFWPRIRSRRFSESGCAAFAPVLHSPGGALRASVADRIQYVTDLGHRLVRRSACRRILTGEEEEEEGALAGT